MYVEKISGKVSNLAIEIERGKQLLFLLSQLLFDGMSVANDETDIKIASYELINNLDIYQALAYTLMDKIDEQIKLVNEIFSVTNQLKGA